MSQRLAWRDDNFKGKQIQKTEVSEIPINLLVPEFYI
jgi:hypothetical protein